VKAQLAFWMLCATDGHAKNFSIFDRPQGAFQLTPLYDMLSAWPVIGHGRNKLAIEDAKLAMSLRGRRSHYRIKEIVPRHFKELALRCGDPPGCTLNSLPSPLPSPQRLPALKRSYRRNFPRTCGPRSRTGLAGKLGCLPSMRSSGMAREIAVPGITAQRGG
jgi:serine/threonine-protein kinase HipA